jgi:hypothetical protein
MGGSEAVGTLDEAAAAPRGGVAARRVHRAEERRNGRGRRPVSEALGRHGSAATCAEGRRREVRRRPARRRTRQRGMAYRTEAMVTLGRSCRNGGKVGGAVGAGVRGEASVVRQPVRMTALYPRQWCRAAPPCSANRSVKTARTRLTDGPHVTEIFQF